MPYYLVFKVIQILSTDYWTKYLLHFTANTALPQILQWVDLTIITNAQCASTFGNIIIASKFCAATSGGRSPCQVSIFRYSSETHFHNTKLATTTQSTPTVTSFHYPISVVQSVLLSNVSIWIGPKSVSNVMNVFFNRIFFKFPSLIVKS